MAAMFEALDTLPQALIGRMHGAALGGGSGLAAICDIVVAADDCVFGFTEVKLGILPAVISPYVVAKIGRSWARQYCVTGMRFTAARAREIGLVHEVVPSAELDATVDRYVHEVLQSTSTGIAKAKRLIREVSLQLPPVAAVQTTEAIAAQRVSPEGQEGMRAFLERRPARWAQTADR
jgi:methylglutaconyl-CoA hydratase